MLRYFIFRLRLKNVLKNFVKLKKIYTFALPFDMEFLKILGV